MRAVFPSVDPAERQFNGKLHTERMILLPMKSVSVTVALPGNFPCLVHKAYQKLRTTQGTCLTQTNTVLPKLI